MNFIFSKHALEQMELRNIPKEMVENVLRNPGQIKDENGRKVYQSIVSFDTGQYLLRIFVSTENNPPLIITVYKTSKINKYYES